MRIAHLSVTSFALILTACVGVVDGDDGLTDLAGGGNGYHCTDPNTVMTCDSNGDLVCTKGDGTTATVLAYCSNEGEPCNPKGWCGAIDCTNQCADPSCPGYFVDTCTVDLKCVGNYIVHASDNSPAYGWECNAVPGDADPAVCHCATGTCRMESGAPTCAAAASPPAFACSADHASLSKTVDGAAATWVADECTARGGTAGSDSCTCGAGTACVADATLGAKCAASTPNPGAETYTCSGDKTKILNSGTWSGSECSDRGGTGSDCHCPTSSACQSDGSLGAKCVASSGGGGGGGGGGGTITCDGHAKETWRCNGISSQVCRDFNGDGVGEWGTYQANAICCTGTTGITHYSAEGAGWSCNYSNPNYNGCGSATCTIAP